MSDLTKQSELKELSPCPFCGSGARYEPSGRSPGYWVQCVDCHASTSDVGTPEKAAELWNTRPASAASSALTPVKQVHKLRHLLNFMPDKDFHLPREEARELLRYIDALRSPASAGVREALESIDAILDAVWSTNDRAEEVNGLVKIKAIIRSALSDHGVLESAAEAITKSDGGERSYCRGCGNQSYDNKFGCSICDIDAERPSDSLLSKTLTEGEKKRPQIETSPANEGSQPSLTTDADLLALLDRARNHVMTPNERYEQRRSFLRGMRPSHRDYADWCAQVDKHVPPLADAVSRTETTGGAV